MAEYRNSFHQRKSQRAAVLKLLLDARGAWVPLPEILALGVAQYNARVYELRRLNFRIENRVEVDPETGVRRSWFRLSPPQSMPLFAQVQVQG